MSTISLASTSTGVVESPYTITEEILQKRLEHTNTGRYITQIFVCIVVSIGALGFGTAIAWSSPTYNPSYMLPVNMFNLTDKDYGILSSLMALGCSIGIAPWVFIIHKIGPKHALILQAPLLLFAFIILITVKKIKMFMAGRFFSGFLSIANILCGQYLLMDTVHRKNYTHMVVVFRSSVLLGVLVTYLFCPLLSKKWLIGLCAAIPTVNTCFLFILPESPVFLYGKGQLKAEKALSWYRGRSNIYSEMREIKKDAEVRKIGVDYRYMLFSKVVLKGLLLALGLTFFQVWSGYYALVFYSVTLYKHYTYVFSPLIDNTIVGLCLFISSILGRYAHYNLHFGVRKPLLLSTFLTASTLSLLTMFSYLHAIHYITSQTMTWVALLLFISIIISYEAGLGTYPEIILLEYLPYQVHAIATCVHLIFYWFQNFLITRYYLVVRHYTYQYVPFAILAIISWLGILYCYIFIVEVKNRTLMQIQITIGGNPIGNRSAFGKSYKM